MRWIDGLIASFKLFRSDRACAACLKPERPWRPMMVASMPGGETWAFCCSDECYDAVVHTNGSALITKVPA